MTIALIIIAFLIYEFIGLATSVGFYEGEDSLILLCLIAWPLVWFVYLATQFGLKIKNKFDKNK